jgi:hypothetical protein
MDWRGASIQNIKLLVCSDCYDTPQEQLRSIIIPADPMPIINARVEDFVNAETNVRQLSSVATTDPITGLPLTTSNYRVTQTGDTRDAQEIGAPAGYNQGAVMPLQNAVTYGTVLPVVSVSSIGTPFVTVTCSQAHGLASGAQVSVAGVTQLGAAGMFTITVTTATAFIYQTIAAMPSGSLLTSTTRIVTVNAGLPLTFTQIPQTGR